MLVVAECRSAMAARTSAPPARAAAHLHTLEFLHTPESPPAQGYERPPELQNPPRSDPRSAAAHGSSIGGITGAAGRGTSTGGAGFSALAGGEAGATARAAWINSANTSVSGAPVSGAVEMTTGGGGGSGSGFALRNGDDRS